MTTEQESKLLEKVLSKAGDDYQHDNAIMEMVTGGQESLQDFAMYKHGYLAGAQRMQKESTPEHYHYDLTCQIEKNKHLAMAEERAKSQTAHAIFAELDIHRMTRTVLTGEVRDNGLRMKVKDYNDLKAKYLKATP
jgi:hypothetical protein